MSSDQARALHVFETDPEMGDLQLIRAPLMDLEVRGVGALKYFGGVVWDTKTAED